MNEVKVTEFRAHLPRYLMRVQAGETLALTVRGRVIARLTPAEDASQLAKDELAALRRQCRLGDVISPVDTRWNATDGDP
ncbi:MAG: type II toxin-antitoxin system Phd/YefM family antitoxin [Gammaproteobacteria bacterium]